MLTEKSSEKQRDLYICCIDYVKAEMGDWVDMQEGGRQGCILSPDSFNLYSEEFSLRCRSG